MAPKPHSKVTENLISSRKRFLIYGNLRKVECIESKRLSRSKMKIIKLDSYFFNVYAACLAVFKVGYGAPQSELGEAIETNTTGRSAEQIQDLPRPELNFESEFVLLNELNALQLISQSRELIPLIYFSITNSFKKVIYFAKTKCVDTVLHNVLCSSRLQLFSRLCDFIISLITL